ncbi:MAG TPA: M23 family metallopeptidase [Thermoanaerobaculia bacterium]
MKATLTAFALITIGWLAWTAAAPRENIAVAEPLRLPPSMSPPSATPAAATAAIAPRSKDEPFSRPSSLPRSLLIPVAGVEARELHQSFTDKRGSDRVHEALDIAAPTGTPVVAVDDGIVRKLFDSKAGGITVYQFDPTGTYCYYYAHLDAYAPGLREGQQIRRGDLIGYVGTSGNAPKDAPHLHFAIARLDADRKWWGGTAIDPYPLLTR